jgi:hypothetical protein
MDYADDVVLTMIEGDILGTNAIEELALVDQGQSDNISRLTSDRDRLRGEVEKLVGSIALGEAPASIVSAIRDRELEIARLEVRIRSPKQAPNIERLRDALTQRAAEWKETLRSEPKVARLLLRRIIGPLVLHDESQRPDFIKADAMVTPGLIDGLAEVPTVRVGDPGRVFLQDVASPAGIEPASRP